MNVLFLCTGNACRSILGEVIFNALAPCPAYFGLVPRTHWGVEDPVRAPQIDMAFGQVYRTLRTRIEAFFASPLEQLSQDRNALKRELDRIGLSFL